MATTAKKVKFPKSLATCADLYYGMRQRRLELQKQVTALEVEEKALKNHLIDHLPKSEASGIAGKVARVTVVTQDEPIIEDWDRFWAHVKKTNDTSLFQHRLAVTAIKELWEDGQQVPGVGVFKLVNLSLNKL